MAVSELRRWDDGDEAVCSWCRRTLPTIELMEWRWRQPEDGQLVSGPLCADCEDELALTGNLLAA